MAEPEPVTIPAFEDVLDWEVAVGDTTKPLRYLSADELHKLSGEHAAAGSDAIASAYSGLELAILAHSVGTVGDLRADAFDAMFWGLDEEDIGARP